MELPDDGRAQDELWFSNILCGVLRGALEMVSSPGGQLPSRWVRSLTRIPGTNADRSALCERCAPRRRHYGDAGLTCTIHRG